MAAQADEEKCNRISHRDRRATQVPRPSAAARSAEMNGSWAITFISNAWARVATSCPIRPRPTRPRVFDRISAPANFDFSHFASFIDASAAGIFRASDRMRPIASSATLRLFAPGAFMTTMPRAVAAATSTLSTPVPARAMTRNFCAASIISRVTFVALRTTSASASFRSSARSDRRTPLAVVDDPIGLLESFDG